MSPLPTTIGRERRDEQVRRQAPQLFFLNGSKGSDKSLLTLATSPRR